MVTRPGSAVRYDTIPYCEFCTSSWPAGQCITARLQWLARHVSVSVSIWPPIDPQSSIPDLDLDPRTRIPVFDPRS